MINILIIDTVVQKYDYNILDNFSLNSVQSGLLQILEKSDNINYYILNNNSYSITNTNVHKYNENVYFININSSLNSIKQQIIDLNTIYNFKIFISINYPVIISKLKENSSFINQEQLNQIFNNSINVLYTTLSPSSKLYYENFINDYNKIICVSNYQANQLIHKFDNKDKFYVIRSQYNKYINSNYNILFDNYGYLLKDINFNNITIFKNDYDLLFLNKLEKLNISIDYLNYKKPVNNIINLIYNCDNNNGLNEVYEIFKMLKTNNEIKYKLTIIKNNKNNSNLIYDKLSNLAKDDVFILDALPSNLLNYNLYQSNIFIYPSTVENYNYTNIIDNLICGNLCFFYNNDFYTEISCGFGFNVNNINEMVHKINDVSLNYINNFDKWKNFLISQIIFTNYFYKNNNILLSSFLNNLVDNTDTMTSFVYESFFKSNNLTMTNLFEYHNIVSNLLNDNNLSKESLLMLLYKIVHEINNNEFINFDIFLDNIYFLLNKCCIINVSKTVKDKPKSIKNNKKYENNLFKLDKINESVKYYIVNNYLYNNNNQIFDKLYEETNDNINMLMNKLIYTNKKLKKSFTNNADIKYITNTLLGIFNKYSNNHLVYNFMCSFYVNNNLINLLKITSNRNKLSLYSNIIKTNLIQILYYEHYKNKFEIKNVFEKLNELKNQIDRNNYSLYMNYRKQQKNEKTMSYNEFILDLMGESFNVNDLSLNYYLYYYNNDDYTLNKKLNELYQKLYPSINYKSSIFDKKIIKNTDKLNITFVSNNCSDTASSKLIKGFLQNMQNVSLVGHFDKFDDTSFDYFSNVKKVYAIDNDNNINTINQFRKNIEDSKPDILIYDCILNDNLIYYIANGRYAPVQMVLGWNNPITTGITNIDYIINMDKSNLNEKYTEKIINMKNLTSILEPISYTNYSLDFITNFNKDKNNIYFCCENIAKYNEEYLQNVILPILKQDKNAFIIFVNKYADNKVGLLNDFNNLLNKIFINYKNKIIVLPKLNNQQYCSLLKLSNVVLDSYPFGSKYSCFETICMDNAFLFINNSALKGRISYTLFNTIGVMNGSCKNYKVLVEKAIKFATNKEEKQKYVSLIKNNKNLLFNKEKIIEEYNEIFQNCYNKYFS